MYQWLHQTYWNNTVLSWLGCIGIIAVGFIILRILKRVALNRLKQYFKKTKTNADDFALKLAESSVLPLCYAGLVCFAIDTLSLHPTVEKILHVAIMVVLVYFVVRIFISFINFFLVLYLEKQNRPQAKEGLRGVMIMVKVMLWIFGLVFLLGNLGYDIKTLLAGLGIGGVAIALAAQSILSDVFAYFAILFDRPFDVGEFLIIGDELGTVTHIGVKTTRIQSLWGEELSYSNKNMLNSWIHNYSRMERRRAVFGLCVSYDTPADKLGQIPEEVKKIINTQEKILIDRVHFFEFRDYGLYFEAVYYSLEPGYTEYRDKQQNINLAVYRKFEEMGVKFAFSTDRYISIRNGSSMQELWQENDEYPGRRR